MHWDSPLVIEAGVFGAAIVIILALALAIPQLPTIRHLLLGVQVPPIIVGYLRAIASVIVGAIATWLLNQVVHLEGTALAALAIPVTGLIHGLWSVLDQTLKKDQNAYHPPAIAGGASPTDTGDAKP